MDAIKLILPKLTQSEIDDLTSPDTGEAVFNLTTGQINYYSGSSWTSTTDTGVGGGGGFDPAYTITVTLNNDAPNNWAPTGLTADTQAIIIIGNNNKVEIKNLDRSLMANGKAILIINAKDGNAEVKIKKNKGGSASNRFLMEKDFKLKPGGAGNFISLDVLDRWGIQFGKF